ncbi:MAG: hypothetical protein ACI9BD_001588, partial [Candidatus Marinamargulisbacteria bacterium]
RRDGPFLGAFLYSGRSEEGGNRSVEGCVPGGGSFYQNPHFSGLVVCLRKLRPVDGADGYRGSLWHKSRDTVLRRLKKGSVHDCCKDRLRGYGGSFMRQSLDRLIGLRRGKMI